MKPAATDFQRLGTQHKAFWLQYRYIAIAQFDKLRRNGYNADNDNDIS